MCQLLRVSLFGSSRLSVVFSAGRFLVHFSPSVFSGFSFTWRFSSRQSALSFARFLLENKSNLKKLKELK